ncbi:MAG: LptF/LptG family permease [Alphaproteobacteria bacterium]
MIVGWTIFRYIALQFLTWFGAFLFGLAGVILLFEVAELLRRAADVPSATVPIVLQMAFFKLPETIEKVLPFVVLFSGMFTFWRLTRSQELVVVRASGVSVWQFLMPVMLTTLALSAVNVTIVNPIGARMIARYWEMESSYLYRLPTLELTGAGLWLRQKSTTYEYLLHADYVTLEPLTLRPLMVIVYDKDNSYIGRIDAANAVLKDNSWIIENAWFNQNHEQAQLLPEFRIPTDLTLQKIQESMAAPNTISFWQLPQFINALQAIGLPALRHQMEFQGLLAQPWMLMAMAFFAAAFSLRLVRRGGTLALAFAGVTVGSFAFALNSVLVALGTTQTLPVALAAWATPLICLASGAAALLYLEDG